MSQIIADTFKKIPVKTPYQRRHLPTLPLQRRWRSAFGTCAADTTCSNITRHQGIVPLRFLEYQAYKFAPRRKLVKRRTFGDSEQDANGDEFTVGANKAHARHDNSPAYSYG